MFTLQQMQAAHNKVKSGADFPAYVQEIKNAGLLYYTFYVTNGATVYTGAGDYEVSGEAKYPAQSINDNGNADGLQQYIRQHQQGHSDFFTFCRQCAECGVERWVVDTRSMDCTYLDKADNALVAEPIPELP